MTVFEALEAAGLVTAAVNMVCYRGPARHAPTVPWLTKPAFGPTRFFYYNLFESDVTGAPLAIRTRARGSVDEYARVVGRWLVTRDGFDFLVFYLPDYDFASHAAGPEAARGRARACRPRDRVAARGGRRARRVPRALRGAPLLGPRPDPRGRSGPPTGRVRRVSSLPAGQRPAAPSSPSPRRTAREWCTACPVAAARRRSLRNGWTGMDMLCSIARTARESRAATVRSSASCRRPPAGTRAAPRTSSRSPKRSSARGRLSATRTPATWSSRRLLGSSSRTSAAATTWAVAATARSSRATRRSR